MKKHMAKASVKKKNSTGKAQSVEARIVELSLQNPEFGAKRLLPFLKSDDIHISASTVYNILKRNGLQNRAKRYEKIQAQQSVVTPSPETVEIPSPPAVALPIPVAQAEVVSEIIKEKKASPRVLPVKKTPEKTKFRSSWFLTLANILLLIMLLYLGFYTLQSLRSFSLAPEAIAAVDPAPTATAARLETAAPPLTDYRIILERNLFNVSKEEVSDPEKEIAVEKIAPAQKNLGVKLMGTAVTDNAQMSRAFIESTKSQQQKAYGEGDAVGQVRIKKIMRNRVIISTAEGDRLLTVDFRGGAASTSLHPEPNKQRRQAVGEYPQQTAERRGPGKSFKLAREEVKASLANIDELEQQLNIEPYLKDDQPAGFAIKNIPPDSILRKMGLKNGNAIMALNDEAITSPDQATGFFQTLAEGGDMNVKVRIGRGVRSRTRWFRLYIE